MYNLLMSGSEAFLLSLLALEKILVYHRIIMRIVKISGMNWRGNFFNNGHTVSKFQNS